MGNKICSKAMRLGIYLPHDANWYADKNNFSNILLEDFRIREYLEKKVKDAIISRIVINRTLDFVEIKIHCMKPSIVVGKKGAEIANISEYLKKLSKKEVRLKVFDVKKPEINAAIVGREIANEMRKKISSTRRIMKKYVQNAMKNGALGIRVECSGRLGGAEIARTEWYQEGAVPRQKLRAFIDYASIPSQASWGTSGVKVWIYKGDNLTVLSKKNLKEGNI